MPAAAEIADEAPVVALSPEKIAQERAAAPREIKPPMEAADDDVVQHPSSNFSEMADKLDKAMKEIGKKESNQPTADTGPVDDKKQTDSKRKPPEETKADTKADAIEDKTITSAKAADWKALKDKLKTFEAQALEYKQKHELTTKEYEEFKKRAVDSGEIEKVKAEMKAVADERAKLQEQLETVALERSEKFSSFYESKFNDSMSRAKDAVGAEKAERIAQLMALPPSQWRKERMNEIRDELAGVDQGQLDIAIAEYDRTRADKEAQLKNSKENYKKLQEIESQKALEEKAAAEKRAEVVLASVLSFARDKFESFKQTEDKEHNATIPDNEKFVERFFKRQMSESEIATLPLLALEARRLSDKVVPALTKKLAEAEAALKELQGANPAASGGSPRTATKGGEKSFTAAFMEAWPGAKE